MVQYSVIAPMITRLQLPSGSLYFIAMALLHLANILLYWLDTPSWQYYPDVEGMSGLANCLSVALMSRLLLNLHEHAHAGVLSTGADTSASLVSGVVFRDIQVHRGQVAIPGTSLECPAEDAAPSSPTKPMKPLSIEVADNSIHSMPHV
ncbi:hypothetical protein PLICRDRAFT_284327 [Plicaturopsis crispa FD-325 SS-3]|nr:hypothetical protein PLICRDRAFT_284327 [Plicaturopsis crispa FD-325 SS-3]